MPSQPKPASPDVFSYQNYVTFLREALAFKRDVVRGAQARLAEHLTCQSAWLSMVLSGKADLSIEQSVGVGEFFGMGSMQRHYFVLLVQIARAGTSDAKSYFRDQLEQLKSGREDLSRRIQDARQLPHDQQAVFYSAWYYSACHIALTIPGLQSIENVSKYLGLTSDVVTRVFDFFLNHGLATQHGDTFSVGATRTHLGASSPYYAQSHANWRLQALQALQRPNPDHFHYSSVVSASRRDLPALREIMTRAIEAMRSIVRESKEEDVFCYNVDLFSPGAAPFQGQ